MQKDRYYKIRKDRHEYWGERYFRLSEMEDKVVQVCLTTGQVKKGKSNTFGIYLIHKLTLFANYMAPGYTEEITKAQYYKQFKKALKMLM